MIYCTFVGGCFFRLIIFFCPSLFILSSLTLSSVICQWAIFAIRNLLENNKENQRIVSVMDCQGLADTSRLRELGVKAVELDNGRIKLVPIKKNS